MHIRPHSAAIVLALSLAGLCASAVFAGPLGPGAPSATSQPKQPNSAGSTANRNAPKSKPPAALTSSAVVKGVPPKNADTYTAKPQHPGVVRLKRNGTTTSVTLMTGGKVSTEGVSALGDALAASKKEKRAIDPGLGDLIARVSDHFGGKVLEVVAGSWSPTPGKKTHAQHTSGRAIDFRVDGVPLEVVRDYCATLPHSGVGYYPNAKLVHLDFRRKSRIWSSK